MWWKKTHKRLFHWKGIDSHGNYQQGDITAINKKSAQQQLQLKHITCTAIKAQHYFSFHNSRICKKQIAQFTNQLTTLLQANVSLSKAFAMLIDNCKHKRLKELLSDIYRKIEQGSTLSQALKQYPQHFDGIYCSLVSAGELSSRLKTVFATLNDYLIRRAQLTSKIKKAMTYPLTILLVAGTITVGLFLLVIPKFQEIFSSFSAKLPAFTRMMISIGEYLQHNGLLLLAVSLILIISYYLLQRYCRRFAKWIDQLYLHLPLISQISLAANLARWSTILATMSEAGVTLHQSLLTANHSLSNQRLQQIIHAATERIHCGQSLQQSLQLAKTLPHELRQLLAIGENTGNLSATFTHLAVFYRQRLNNIVDNLSKLLEPIIIIVISGITGCLIIAMYLPIFKIGMVF